METEALLYLAPLLVGGIISLLLIGTLFPRRSSPTIRMFLVFLGAICLWTFAYILELWTDAFQPMLLWRKIRYVGVCLAPVLWFCFAMRYSNREKCTRPATVALLSVIPAIALIFLWMSGHQGLFFTEMTAVPGGPFQVIRDTPGPFFWLQAAYAYLLIAAGIAVILRSAASTAGIYVRQSLTVVGGILAPLLGNVLVLLTVNPAGFPYDVTPALFPIAAVAIWWSVTRFRFLDLVPVAGKALFDSLDDVVFVVDDRNRIVDGNPAAFAFLRSTAAETTEGNAVGRPAADVFADHPRLADVVMSPRKTQTTIQVPSDGQSTWYEVTVSPLHRRGQKAAGRLITLRDVTARRNVAEALRHRVELQELISRLSARFINLPPDDIDTGIQDALQKIGQFVGADRSYVFQLYDDGARMDNTHEWCTEGVEPQQDRLQRLPADTFSWWMDRLRRFEAIHLPRLADLPPEAQPEKDLLRKQDIRSLVAVPLVYRQSLVGFIGFDAVHEEKRWSDETINMLRLVGDIIVSALERKQAEAERAYQRQYFQALFDDSPEAIVSLDARHRAEEVNPAFESLFGYTGDELQGETPDDYILPPEHRDEGKAITRRVMNGEVVTTETVRMSKDGKRIPVSLLAAPIIIDGTQEGIFGIYRDISDQKSSHNIFSFCIIYRIFKCTDHR
ncbi:MAG: histidine kinase N-terminal 7TM domain-containing protein [Thermoplasmatota archaeon]